MGLLAYRYRFRVLIAATVAAGVIAFLIAGLGGLMTVVHSAYVGGLTGVVKRQGRGTRTVIVVSLIAGAVFDAVRGRRADGADAAAAPDLRRHHRQRRRDCGRLDRDRPFRDRRTRFRSAPASEWTRSDRSRAHWFIAHALHYWQWLMLANGVVSIDGRVVDRMVGVVAGAGADARHSRRAQTGRPAATVAPIGPVPVRLDQVRFRYPEHRPRRAATGRPGGARPANTSRSPEPTVPARPR